MSKSFLFTHGGLFSSKRTMLMITLLFLSFGCGPPYINPDKTSEQFGADDKECKAAALEVCPPNMEWNSGRESMRFERSNTKERGYQWWDANLNQRSIVYNECMETRGWKKR